MKEALFQAERAKGRDEVPVGAVLVYEGEIVVAGGNEVRGLKDPSAHAEMRVICQGCRDRGSFRLDGYDLYVTLEPCVMCAAVISFVRLRRVYFGCYDLKNGGVEHGVRWFEQPGCHHRPEVIGGIEEEACSRILREFFAEKRG